MEKVAQSDQAELYLDREDALLYLVDKQSGIAIQTKVMDGKSGNGSVKANQKSDFIISYFLNSKATSAQSLPVQVQLCLIRLGYLLHACGLRPGGRISMDSHGRHQFHCKEQQGKQ